MATTKHTTGSKLLSHQDKSGYSAVLISEISKYIEKGTLFYLEILEGISPMGHFIKDS